MAGKEADFLVTVKKIEAQHLPEVNEAFAKALGIKEATVEGLRADIKKNLEREMKFRVLARNKSAAMEAADQAGRADVPNALVENEAQRMVGQAREDLKKRGVKDADKAEIPADIFSRRPSARAPGPDGG